MTAMKYIGTAVVPSVAKDATGSAQIILGHAPAARKGDMGGILVLQVEAVCASNNFDVSIVDRADGTRDTIHEVIRIAGINLTTATCDDAKNMAPKFVFNDDAITPNSEDATHRDMVAGDGNDAPYVLVHNDAEANGATGEVKVRTIYLIVNK